jgi:hypothetical protein
MSGSDEFPERAPRCVALVFPNALPRVNLRLTPAAGFAYSSLTVMESDAPLPSVTETRAKPAPSGFQEDWRRRCAIGS